MAGRTYLRGIASEQYSLKQMQADRVSAPRVRSSDPADRTKTHGATYDTDPMWRMAPGDDPFLTQSIQVHFVWLPPGRSNRGHGHQNEAVFYILAGRGHEVHDGERYDWEKGDLVFVHTDSMHQHFNDGDEEAVCIVMKAKSMWMYLGLVQQGHAGPVEDEEAYGPREDWSRIWTPNVVGRTKVVKPTDTPWADTPDGRVRWMSAPWIEGQRVTSVDVFEQVIPPGGQSGRRWQMADEILYVLSGSGTSVQWQVQAELDDKYYARIARQPTMHRFGAGDTVYVPPNHVRRFVNEGTEPLHLLSAQNRVFRVLGYDSAVVLEPAKG